MKVSSWRTVLSILLWVALGCSGQSPVTADLVLVGGKVWTVDRAQPEVQAGGKS